METDDETPRTEYVATSVRNDLLNGRINVNEASQRYYEFAKKLERELNRLLAEWLKQAEPEIIDSLDWNRLISGERRALMPEHQEWFDKLYASPPTAPGMVSVPRERLMNLIDWLHNEVDNQTCSDVCDKTYEAQGCPIGTCAIEDGNKEVCWWESMIDAASKELAAA